MIILLLVLIIIIYLYLEQLFKNNLKNRTNKVKIYVFFFIIILVSEIVIISYINNNDFISLFIIFCLHFIFFRNVIKFLLLKIYFNFFVKLYFFSENKFRENLIVFILRIKYYFFGYFFKNLKFLKIIFYLFFIILFIFSYKIFIIFYIVFNLTKFYIYKLDYNYDGLVYGKYRNTDVEITKEGFKKINNYIEFLFNQSNCLDKIYLNYDVIDLDFY